MIQFINFALSNPVNNFLPTPLIPNLVYFRSKEKTKLGQRKTNTRLINIFNPSYFQQLSTTSAAVVVATNIVYKGETNIISKTVINNKHI